MVISQYWSPEDGVPQRRLAWLTQELRDRGHLVSVITPPPHYPIGTHLSPQDPTVKANAVFPGPAGEIVFRSRFKEHDRSLQQRVADQSVIVATSWRKAVVCGRKARRLGRPVDVIVSTVPALPSGVLGALVAARLRVAHVLDLRDPWPDLLLTMDAWLDAKETQAGTSRLVEQIRQAGFRRILHQGGRALSLAIKRADTIVTTTNVLRDKLRAEGHKQVHTVYNAMPSQGTRLPATYNNTGTLRVLYAGTVGRMQGLSEAVSAAHLAQQQGTKVELRIVGGGADLHNCRDLAHELNAPVRFFTRTDSTRLLAHFKWADTILVQLRPWPILDLALPSKLIEAINVGRHVSGNVGGEAARLIKDSGCGHVVDRRDAQGLAELWVRLQANRNLITTAERTENWVKEHLDSKKVGTEFCRMVENAAGV